MKNFEELLTGVDRLEQMGGLQEAIELLEKLIKIFPEHQNDLELRILQIMYQQERYEDALDEAVNHIDIDDGRIFRWLVETYYDPYREESEDLHKHNMECLAKYEYFYGAGDKHGIKTLLYDGYKKIVFCGETTIGRYIGIPKIEMAEDEIYLISNVVNVGCLAEQISETKYRGNIPNYENPVYLYYDEDIFQALLQCVQIDGIIKDKRTVLLVGEAGLRSFFQERQVRIPDIIVGTGVNRIQQIIDDVFCAKEEELQKDKHQIEAYYCLSKEAIDERIRQKKPKILFYTSYFTTILKYHTRDMIRSAQKMGLETELLIEKGSFFGINDFECFHVINIFRPDIIFCIDHFRFEQSAIPKEIVWVCWVQDPLTHIMDKNTPLRLGDRDFVLNHFTTWKEFQDIGYASDRIMDAPIPSSQDIYMPYVLTDDEKANYNCDICFVCHASDVDVHIVEVAQQFPEEWGDMIASVYKGYQSYVYETGGFFYQKDLFEQYIEGALVQHFGIIPSDVILKYLVDDMYLWFNQRVLRETLVDWLLDAGYVNIKLWGNGWKMNPKYTPYAMGPAENGETLSKIYQSSKIVVGNNIVTTAAARAWETMLSGGFYLSNYIPVEADVTDIRKIVEVGKDVIMFYNRDDLIEKIHYYLEHEEERKEMIEKGRRVALEKMTFDSLTKRMLEKIAQCI